MTSDKYEILEDQVLDLGNAKLYRIRALKDISKKVLAGTLGGYISYPGVLSQEGNCWVHRDAKAFGGCSISGDAEIRGRSTVAGPAVIKGTVLVDDDAQVIGKVEMDGHQILNGQACLINVPIVQTGQFVRNGHTVFTFLYLLGGQPVSLSIKSQNCTDKLATELSLLQKGQSLVAYLSSIGTVSGVRQFSDSEYLKYSDVEAGGYQ